MDVVALVKDEFAFLIILKFDSMCFVILSLHHATSHYFEIRPLHYHVFKQKKRDNEICTLFNRPYDSKAILQSYQQARTSKLLI